MERLKDKVLAQLKKGDATAKQLTEAIYGPQERPWEKDVALFSQVLSVLLKLKHEHRVWTVDHSTWTITSKGKKHG